MKKKNEKRLEFHEVANLFPMMTAQEMEALKEDIAKNGIQEPIYLFQGKIVDGRNRYIACMETGIKPIFRNYKGKEADLLDFADSLNNHRRHYNMSQKACIAVNRLPQIEKRTKENLSKKMSAIRKGNTEDSAILQSLNTSQTASKIYAVSERYIFEAKKLLKDDAELFDKVFKGELSLQQARKQFTARQVSATLQNPKNENGIELSKYDIVKINNLVSELGITEQKARDYILKRKRPVNSKSKTNKTFKEVKFRITEDTKTKLQIFAKQQGKSLSETIRDLLENRLKKS